MAKKSHTIKCTFTLENTHREMGCVTQQGNILGYLMFSAKSEYVQTETALFQEELQLGVRVDFG